MTQFDAVDCLHFCRPYEAAVALNSLYCEAQCPLAAFGVVTHDENDVLDTELWTLFNPIAASLQGREVLPCELFVQ